MDDAAQEITHVTRGADMEAATDIHMPLQMLLGLGQPVYTFHKLSAGCRRRKNSSKSSGFYRRCRLRGGMAGGEGG